MDTTLRDGEQTSGVSFSVQEKLSIARLLLEDVGVDRLEIASARVSDGEFEAVRRIVEWAERNGHLYKLEVLGFVDGEVSLNWIRKAGCKVINLLCKGSYRHVKYQLKKTPEQHIADIKALLQKADSMGIDANIYLEDWSNGMKDSKEYVFTMVDALQDEKIRRFMLPDTLGVLNPDQTYTFCREMRERYPQLHFDFHPHNDYDLAVANVFSAVKAKVNGVHTTVNGLGERAGNAPLSSVVAILHDQLKVKTSIREKEINHVSRMVETYSGMRIPSNMPVVGENVFTQCAGVHADGDSKNNLYYNDLLPERFGRVREYALGKTSGKANIRKNLENLGIELDDDSMKKVTERIIQLGDKKEMVTPEDLPYILSDVLGYDQSEQRIKLLNYSLSIAQGLHPAATVKVEIDGQQYQETASGDGQYDAFVRAMRKIYKELGRPFPILTNYSVSIPPGGRTDAFVQTIISWRYKEVDFKTRGLEADQTEAAIVATLKMLNKIERM
ncbi:MAG: alpha-isopropylmalate synthase regulatory domain-containing protein [Bacteroidales bacterium]|nr:alpha-isopropylmalate synthase regulatory domain-containing protein [Bacteroidales bacterium]